MPPGSCEASPAGSGMASCRTASRTPSAPSPPITPSMRLSGTSTRWRPTAWRPATRPWWMASCRPCARSSTGMSREPGSASAWIRPTVSFAQASRASSSPGWTRRPATGSSPHGSASRWRSRPSGSTPAGSLRGPARLASTPQLRPATQPWRSELPRHSGRASSSAELGHCLDVVDGPDGDDPALRPNQLFGVTLEPDLLARRRRHERSWTPWRARCGSGSGCDRWLRPTPPTSVRIAATASPAMRPTTRGPPGRGSSGRSPRRCCGPERRPPTFGLLLDAFADHLRDAGLGTISECLEGDPPHRPVGCYAQAWSVAEVLRAIRLAT